MNPTPACSPTCLPVYSTHRLDGYDWHVEYWCKDISGNVLRNVPGNISTNASKGGSKNTFSDASTRPTALLLHGTGASTHTWTNLAPTLFRNMNLVAIDLPGHGRTGATATADLSLVGVARAVASLMKTMNITPDWAIGHSAGAAIAAQLHLQESMAFQRIVSLNGALLPLGGAAGWFFSPLARLGASTSWLPRVFASRARDPRHVRRLLESTGSRVDDASLEQYAKLFRDPKHVAGVLRLMASWHLEILQPRLPRLNTTVHLIAGSNDRTIPLRHARQLERLLPNSHLSVIDGVGHLAHEEAADRVFQVIDGQSSQATNARTAISQTAASGPTASASSPRTSHDARQHNAIPSDPAPMQGLTPIQGTPTQGSSSS